MNEPAIVSYTSFDHKAQFRWHHLPTSIVSKRPGPLSLRSPVWLQNTHERLSRFWVLIISNLPVVCVVDNADSVDLISVRSEAFHLIACLVLVCESRLLFRLFSSSSLASACFFK